MSAHVTPQRTAHARRFARAATFAATAGLAIGLIAGPSPASAKPKKPTTACTPGDIKKSGGKTYVCNAKGKWIHTLYLTAGATAAIKHVSITAAAPPTATPAPTPTVPVDPDTTVVAKAKDGSGPATCEYAAGITLNEGDVVESITNTYGPDGKIQNQYITKYKCGSDGNLHSVAMVADAGIDLSHLVVQVSTDPVDPGQLQQTAGGTAVVAKDNAGTPATTCEGFGGGKPGDTVTVQNTIKVNGKVVFTDSLQQICGKDGLWHPVALVALPGGTIGPIQVAASPVIAQAQLAQSAIAR